MKQSSEVVVWVGIRSQGTEKSNGNDIYCITQIFVSLLHNSSITWRCGIPFIRFVSNVADARHHFI